jgi:SPP1 gp7 family putative phage head morphogenesis protein
VDEMATGQRWLDMRDTLAEDLNNTNKIARSISNGYMPEAYAINRNYGMYEIESGYGINTSFTLYNRQTVERLIKEEPEILPKPGKTMAKKLQEGKALKWQRGQIQSVVLQAVLQGESIPNMAKRISKSLGVSNEAMAVRYARTAITGAQNAGRQDSYQHAKDLGLDVEQEWLATPDARTRDSHVALDGERRPLGEKFSNKCRYPADPQGPPSEVYNCRCRIVAVLKDHNYQDNWRFTRLPKGMTYEEWKNRKPKAPSSTIVNGKDLSMSWVRRPDMFAFEIEDVINAQGFDGLPRVVSAEEFDRAVHESEMLCLRGYTAPDEETLEAYQDALYHGKWYVDCSNGGSAYGRGMYSAYSNNLNYTEEAKSVAENYARGRNDSLGKVETFTIDKDAKVITYNDLMQEYNSFKSGGYDRISALARINANSDEEWAYIMYNSGQRRSLSDEEYDMAKKFEETVSEKRYYELDDIIENIYASKRIGTSEYAVLKGYDVILVEQEEYAIILNRTKLIIKGE